MRCMEGLMCWFKPSHWRDHHSLKAEEQPNPVDGADGYTDPRDGVSQTPAPAPPTHPHEQN
jgi:hypothetical protein